LETHRDSKRDQGGAFEIKFTTKEFSIGDKHDKNWKIPKNVQHKPCGLRSYPRGEGGNYENLKAEVSVGRENGSQRVDNGGNGLGDAAGGLGLGLLRVLDKG
jgi:hypothetical protein